MSTIEQRKKELQEQVDNLEEDINERINDVKAKVQDTLSVQKWVNDYPLQTVGLSLLAGFLIAHKSSSSKNKTNSETTFATDIKQMVIAEIKKQVLKKVMEKVTERFS